MPVRTTRDAHRTARREDQRLGGRALAPWFDELMRGSTRSKRLSKGAERAGVCAPRARRRFHTPVWQLLTTISSFCPGFRVRITLLTLNRFRRARLSRFPKILRPHPVAAPMDTKQSTRRAAREKSMRPTHEQCAAASPISDVPPPRWLGLRPGQRSTENEHENDHNSPHCCTASPGIWCVCA